MTSDQANILLHEIKAYYDSIPSSKYRHADLDTLKEKFEHLRGKVDAVNVTDNQTAVVRMSSAAASAIMVASGVEPNFQMVCRDRNRLAMMADVLGVYSLGVRNMLCLSGDHMQFGDHPQAKPVFDRILTEVIRIVNGQSQ